MNYRDFSATRWIVTVYGLLVGFAGIEHGIFEALQGNIPTEGIMINAIGPDQTFWLGASERALTIIPNYLITGILAIVFGIIVILWSLFYVERKYGATLFLVFTLTLFLVGGGFAPIFVSLTASATATRINQPLNWWKNHLPNQTSKLWPWTLVLFVVVFILAVGMQIFGAPFTIEITTSLVTSLALGMLLLIPVGVVTGFAFDISNMSD